MTNKMDSKWLALATASILGQPPRSLSLTNTKANFARCKQAQNPLAGYIN